MKKNIPATSIIQTHPDYAMFHRFGSSLNFLSRENISGNFLQKGHLSPHFTKSQTAFANHSMSALIELVRKFQPQEMFTKESAQISDNFRGAIYLEEVWNVEEFYLEVTKAREFIDENTQPSYEKFQTRQNLKEESEIKDLSTKEKEVATTLKHLKYLDFEKQSSTYTHLTSGSRYSKYVNLNQEMFGTLRLSHFTNLLGVFDAADAKVIVGMIEAGEDDNEGCVVHKMGLYKDVPKYRRHNPQAFEERDEMVRKVDYVTALAAKKALTTEDQDEALKYAFIFGALRGYNVRSVIGACWAQEMSMRWIFAQKDWPQFRKMPGIYLDIEASLVGTENPEQKLKELIEREVREYKMSVGLAPTPPKSFYEYCKSLVGPSKAPDHLFDKPLSQQENDFPRYLIDTKKYRAEDLSEMISYKEQGKENRNIFQIAAAAGDKDFFELLNQELRSNPDLKKKIMTTNIGWSTMLKGVEQYGDSEAKRKVLDFYYKVKSNSGSFDLVSNVRNLQCRDAKIGVIEEEVACKYNEVKEFTPPASDDPSVVVTNASTEKFGNSPREKQIFSKN